MCLCAPGSRTLFVGFTVGFSLNMTSADECKYNCSVPKLRLLPAAVSDDGEQQSDHGGHQQAEQQPDPHVAPLDLDLD